MAGYDLGGSFPAAKYLQFTQSRNHSFHLILLFSPTVMRGSDIVAKVAFILLLACLLLLVSLSPDC